MGARRCDLRDPKKCNVGRMKNPSGNPSRLMRVARRMRMASLIRSPPLPCESRRALGAPLVPAGCGSNGGNATGAAGTSGTAGTSGAAGSNGAAGTGTRRGNRRGRDNRRSRYDRRGRLDGFGRQRGHDRRCGRRWHRRYGRRRLGRHRRHSGHHRRRWCGRGGDRRTRRHGRSGGRRRRRRAGASGGAGGSGGATTCPAIADFGNWTAGKGPADVGRLAANDFKSHTGDTYGGAGYALAFSWFGALRFTKLTGDTANNTTLITAFEPYATGQGRSTTRRRRRSIRARSAICRSRSGSRTWTRAAAPSASRAPISSG